MSAMDQWSKAVGGPIGVAIAVIGVAGVLIYFGKQAKEAVAAGVKAVGDVNKGTSYEGAGVVGTLGNVTNQVSGGFFERLGSSIGGALADAKDALTRRTETPSKPTTFTPRTIAVNSEQQFYSRYLK
jgi:hypothetical protein